MRKKWWLSLPRRYTHTKKKKSTQTHVRETRVHVFFFLSKHSLSFPLLSQSFRDYGVSTLEQHFYSCDARVSCSARRSTAAFVAKKKKKDGAGAQKKRKEEAEFLQHVSSPPRERRPGSVAHKGGKKKRANTNDENKKKKEATVNTPTTQKKSVFIELGM